jgi:3-hydroxyisobutyrate dehydrogenase-like beta-hydroxyacid dehydrogenase
MAHKLLDVGHGLRIYDVNAAAMAPLLERQARPAVSPHDLADR